MKEIIEKEEDNYNVVADVILGVTTLGIGILLSILGGGLLIKHGIAIPVAIIIIFAIMLYVLSGRIFGRVVETILGAINSYEYVADEEEIKKEDKEIKK